MELENLINAENLTTDINEFVKDLEKEINKGVNINDIKIDENSTLSFVNNIAKNNKLTSESTQKLFFQEIQSVFDIYRENKKAGELYYLVSKGANKDFYVCKVNNNYSDELCVIMNKSAFPTGAKAGEIYRMKKNGEMYFSEDETKVHEEKMLETAKEILKTQELNGGYKKEYKSSELSLGEGYSSEYLEYPFGIFEKFGKEVGIPPTMINVFLKNDLKEICENNAKTISENKTIYTVLPNSLKLTKISNGEIQKIEESDPLSKKDFFNSDNAKIFITDESGNLVEEKESTELFQNSILEDMKSTLKPKYDKICDDYQKNGHIYEVSKSLDENFVPTITLNDLTENRYLELEDLNFIENQYSGNGKYVAKNGEYYKINSTSQE